MTSSWPWMMITWRHMVLSMSFRNINECYNYMGLRRILSAPRNYRDRPWWLYVKETHSALLALCEGKPPMVSGSPHKRSVMWNFWCFLCYQRKQSIGQIVELPMIWDAMRNILRHSNDNKLQIQYHPSAMPDKLGTYAQKSYFVMTRGFL